MTRHVMLDGETSEEFLERTLNEKKAVVGRAAVVLNPLRDSSRGGVTDRADDTALLIQTLERVNVLLGSLYTAVKAPDHAHETMRMITRCQDMLRERMGEQG